MSLSTETALEILGLPSFATAEDIVLRYKFLSLRWFPEKHSNSSFAIQEFRNINEAVLQLLYPEKKFPYSLNLGEMYGIFQYIFFGRKDSKDEEINVSEGEDGYCDSDISTEEDSKIIDEAEENEANFNAAKLIVEEEKEKLKAEKRKAKKKRRKERKKQQKSEKGSTAEQVIEPSSSGPKRDKDKFSASEEDIDTSSAFVAVIAKKQQIPVLEAKNKSDSNSHQGALQLNEDRTSVVLRSRQLALRGNEMANLEHFVEAADLFSESIKLDPSDHRFYGNRSYCFERLCQYERALKDAEKAIALCPAWPKGYFRKGRALLGIKKYAVAEECFVHVLKLDNDCEAAISELHKAKVLQIMEAGFSKEQAETALSHHGSVRESIQSLLAGGVSQLKVTDEVDVFISDDESDGIRTCVAKSRQSPQDYDIKMDPKNPEGHSSLWVGNVQSDVTEKKLTSLFAKCGELLSIKVMPEKFCAFVNYKNKSAPGKAMFMYQGFDLHGGKLLIRFPNLSSEPAKKKERPSGPVNGVECYFWRTTGCIYGEHCHNLHIKEHKGIDKKKWHVT